MGPCGVLQLRANTRQAFEDLTKKVLPATHLELQRALECEARAYSKSCSELSAAARTARVTAEDDARSRGEPDGEEG